MTPYIHLDETEILVKNRIYVSVGYLVELDKFMFSIFRQYLIANILYELLLMMASYHLLYSTTHKIMMGYISIS